jgi:hypothetical protein
MDISLDHVQRQGTQGEFSPQGMPLAGLAKAAYLRGLSCFNLREKSILRGLNAGEIRINQSSGHCYQ